MGKLVFFFLIMIGNAFATVKVGQCPEEFIGRVKSIQEAMTAERTFETQQIIFSNVETLRGEVDEEVILELLKGGPFKLEEGPEYRVQLRNGKLCWLEKI
jgi:hypothetical protein